MIPNKVIVMSNPTGHRSGWIFDEWKKGHSIDMQLQASKGKLESALNRLVSVAGNTSKSRVIFDGSPALFTISGPLFCKVPLDLTFAEGACTYEVPLKEFRDIVKNSVPDEGITLTFRESQCRLSQSVYDIGLPALRKDGVIPEVCLTDTLSISKQQISSRIGYIQTFVQDLNGYVEYSIAEIEDGVLYGYDGVKAARVDLLDILVSLPIQQSALKGLGNFFESSRASEVFYKETENLFCFGDGVGWVAFRKDRRKVSQDIKTFLNEAHTGAKVKVSTLFFALKRLKCVMDTTNRAVTLEFSDQLTLKSKGSTGISSSETVRLEERGESFTVKLDLRALYDAVEASSLLGAEEFTVSNHKKRGFILFNSPETQVLMGVYRDRGA